jgi:hypothetical protein
VRSPGRRLIRGSSISSASSIKAEVGRAKEEGGEGAGAGAEITTSVRWFLAAGAEGDAGNESAWDAGDSIGAEAGDDAEGTEGRHNAEGLPTGTGPAAD